MRILFPGELVGLDNKPTIILLLGYGLIGSSITEKLMYTYGYSSYVMEYLWDVDENESRRQESVVFQYVIKKAYIIKTRNASLPISISVVWAAGKAGFGSTEEEMAKELLEFRRIIQLACKIKDSVDDAETTIFFISSAGGLFEGQRCVVPNSAPKPSRPYGRVKLEQEKILELFSGKIKFCIYRPSTVYGPIIAGQRRGLLANMLNSGIKQQVCTIFGTLSTLRDFVYAPDIGTFIASEILSRTPLAANHPLILAGFRPYSILEIKTIVETVIKHKIYIALDPSPENALDITYSPLCNTNQNWKPINVDQGIRNMNVAILNNGLFPGI